MTLVLNSKKKRMCAVFPEILSHVNTVQRKRTLCSHIPPLLEATLEALPTFSVLCHHFWLFGHFIVLVHESCKQLIGQKGKTDCTHSYRQKKKDNCGKKEFQSFKSKDLSWFTVVDSHKSPPLQRQKKLGPDAWQPLRAFILLEWSRPCCRGLRRSLKLQSMVWNLVWHTDSDDVGLIQPILAGRRSLPKYKHASPARVGWCFSYLPPVRHRSHAFTSAVLKSRIPNWVSVAL